MESDFSCQRKRVQRAFCIWPVFVRRDSADFICGRMAAFLVSIHNFLKGGLMPKYQYTAKDVAGKKKKGQLMAADEAALYELLRGENLFLISCRLAQKEKKIHTVLLQGSFLSSVGSLELCLAQVFRL